MSPMLLISLVMTMTSDEGMGMDASGRKVGLTISTLLGGGDKGESGREQGGGGGDTDNDRGVATRHPFGSATESRDTTLKSPEIYFEWAA